MPLVSRNFNIGVVGANMESAHYQKYLKHMRHNTDASVRLAETHEVRRRRTLAPPHPRRTLAKPHPRRCGRSPAPFHPVPTPAARAVPRPRSCTTLRG